jgi:diguanylate cyclase (GGDEF)-like protein
MFCVARDITQRKGAQEKLRILATFDDLTGLMNRAAIKSFLAREMDRATCEDRALSVILLDLDHFKLVNDTHGHAAGDIVLQAAAQRIKSSLRGYDEVGRYGGEEFLIVAPSCSIENVMTLVERIRNNIGNTPVDIDGKMLPISCSLGAASIATGQREDIDALIERADAALYRAKANGRNQGELALLHDSSLLDSAQTALICH